MFFMEKRFECSTCGRPIVARLGFVWVNHLVVCPDCNAEYILMAMTNKVIVKKAGVKMKRPEPRKDGPMKKLGECLFLRPDLQGNFHCVEGGCYHDIPGTHRGRSFVPFSPGGVFHEGKPLLRCCAACKYLPQCVKDKTACASYV